MKRAIFTLLLALALLVGCSSPDLTALHPLDAGVPSDNPPACLTDLPCTCTPSGSDGVTACLASGVLVCVCPDAGAPTADVGDGDALSAPDAPSSMSDVLTDTGLPDVQLARDVPSLDVPGDVGTDAGADVPPRDTGVDVGGCGAGLTACGDAGCVNTMTDPNNCGGCENIVGFHNATQHGGGMCIGGHGEFVCDPNWADCDGVLSNGCEANLTGSPNCGGCGHICTGSISACEPESADGGYCCTGVPGCS